MQVSLRELSLIFLKLGIIGFGGPAAHIALMHDEFVKERAWLSEQEFLDLVGATNLIPGPNSTELAIHIGYLKGGWKGLILAGLSFIMPAVLITGVLAWVYLQYGETPAVQPFLYGIKPAIVAVVLMAVVPLAKKSIKTPMLFLIGIVVLIGGFFLNIHEFYLMFGTGFLALIYSYWRSSLASFIPIPLLLVQNSFSEHSNVQLFWIFLKIGSILYGSGYVLFAFLDTELVARGWLSKQVLTDAIAIGQFTPGPVFSSVTFIGFQINGVVGAIVATIAIFLPSFLFVALLHPLVKFLRNSTHFSAFLDAVNVASVALIVLVCVSMAQEAVQDWKTILLAILSVCCLLFKKINSVWIILGGAMAGYLLSYLS